MSEKTPAAESGRRDPVEELFNVVSESLQLSKDEVDHLTQLRLFSIASGEDLAESEALHLDRCQECKGYYQKYLLALKEEPEGPSDAQIESFVSESVGSDVLPEASNRAHATLETSNPFAGQKIKVSALKESLDTGIGEWLSRVNSLSDPLEKSDLPETINEAVLNLQKALAVENQCAATVFESILRRVVGDTNGNPVLETAVNWGVQLAHSAGEYAMKQLNGQLGELKGKSKACSASVWLLNDDGSIESLLSFNNFGNQSYQIDQPGKSLIRSVAETPEAGHRFVHDVSAEKDYHKALDGVCSELVIPLFLEPPGEAMRFRGKDKIGSVGRFIGVLDLQFSTPPCGLAPTQEDEQSFLGEVHRQVLRLLPDLEVLETLRTCNEDWCCYHPDLHSASWHEPLELLCHEICGAIGRERATMTIWSADWQRKVAGAEREGDLHQLNAYATSGYDYEFQSWNQLPVGDSVTGRVLQSALNGDGFFDTTKPADEFREKERAKQQRIREAFIAAIPVKDEPKELRDLFGTVNLYLYGDIAVEEETRAQIRQSLPQLARFIGRMTSAHSNARRRFVAELVTLKLDTPHEGQSVKPRLYNLRSLIDEFFGPTVASSIWIKHNRRLYCAEADRLFRFNAPLIDEAVYFPPTRHRVAPFEQDRWGPIYYDLDDLNHQGFTTRLAMYSPGDDPRGLRVLRKKVEGKWRETKAQNCLEPSGRFSEHFSVEMQYDRWFIGISVFDENQETIGVIRMVRPRECRPFTWSDEKLLKTIAHGVAKVFAIWRVELDLYFRERKEESKRLNQQVRFVEAGEELCLNEKLDRRHSSSSRDFGARLKEVIGHAVEGGNRALSHETRWFENSMD